MSGLCPAAGRVSSRRAFISKPTGVKEIEMDRQKDGCADGCGAMIAELADLMLRGKGRTFADAVKTAAKRRHFSEFDFLRAAFAETGGDVAETMRRRIEQAVLAELTERRTVAAVDCPDGIGRRARFSFHVDLDFAARLALGMISRERRGLEWLRSEFSAAVGGLLMNRATEGKVAAKAFERGLRLVEWARGDADRGRIAKAPDALAMPDGDAELGFVTLRERGRA